VKSLAEFIRSEQAAGKTDAGESGGERGSGSVSGS
jgi:hypothetical protein